MSNNAIGSIVLNNLGDDIIDPLLKSFTESPYYKAFTHSDTSVSGLAHQPSAVLASTMQSATTTQSVLFSDISPTYIPPTPPTGHYRYRVGKGVPGIAIEINRASYTPDIKCNKIHTTKSLNFGISELKYTYFKHCRLLLDALDFFTKDDELKDYVVPLFAENKLDSTQNQDISVFISGFERDGWCLYIPSVHVTISCD